MFTTVNYPIKSLMNYANPLLVPATLASGGIASGPCHALMTPTQTGCMAMSAGKPSDWATTRPWALVIDRKHERARLPKVLAPYWTGLGFLVS